MRIPALALAPVLAYSMLVVCVNSRIADAQNETRADCGCTDDPPFVRNPVPIRPQLADLARVNADLSSDCATAAIASRKLGMLSDQSSVAPLIRALRHKSCRVRDAAAQSLGQLG